MLSERVQRQIDGLLDAAEAAVSVLDWARVRECGRGVLAVDPDNQDARAFLVMADAAAQNGNVRATSTITDSQTPLAGSPEPHSTPLPATFAGGRYAVKSFLGEGGRKRVYLAHDDKLDRDVAVAIIKTSGLDALGLSRVRREAQAMGRIGDHPHIVTIHDVGDDAGQPYIVSQYMAGGAVDKFELPLSVDRAMAVAKDVCRGLAHAHQHGIVHRDLKLGNVWLTADGTAKIGDFGLAVSLDRSRLTMAGMMVGTVAYMPPEQALGGETTPRADLYSLGCMLYEMVTGRPPFVSDNPTAVISQHINTAPVAPSWLTEHCPPELEELILRLLAKDPAARPADAASVLAILDRIDPAQKSASHSESNVLDRLARGVFVGRERELERLRKAFDEALAGRGSMVMLVGEPGIGKTSAAQELETYARMRGGQVLWGRAHESSGAPAYWPWMQIGNQFAAANDLTKIQPDMQAKGPHLAALFPWLREQANFIEPEAIADPEAAQFRLFDAYATFVRAMSNSAPLVIALDDLHWADKPSLLLLEYIARELSRARVLVVCTYRDTDLSRTHPLSEALATLNREAGFQRVALKGLSRDEVAAYIRAAANVTPKAELLDRIFEETEGNPFFLSEVVNLLTQEGKLTESVSDIAVPDGVREALGRRLDRISEEANELLQIAAVAGREFPYETLTLLSDHDEDTLLRLIEEALEARVIEEMEQPGRYRFTHALMQETLLDELSTTRRVRIHGQVGEALERRWGARADERATRLAVHFVEAAMISPRHAAKAVHYSRLAAQQAEVQFAWDVAARHYEHCLTLVGDDPGSLGEDEAALLTSLGICARNDGEYRAAWRALMRGIGVYRERSDAAGVARATLAALMIDAPAGRKIQLTRDALEMVEGRDPYFEARLLTWAALVGYQGTEEAARSRDRASALAESHDFEDVRAHVEAVDGTLAANRQDLETAASLFRSSFERFSALGHSREAAQAIFNQAFYLALAGEFDRAIIAAEAGLAYARQHRIRFAEQVCSDVIASIHLARCEFEALERIVEERGPDSGYLLSLFEAIRAEAQGDHERAVARLPDPALAGGAPMFLGQILAGRARVLWNAGFRDRARAEFDGMLSAMRDNPLSHVVDGIALHGAAYPVLDDALPALATESLLRAALAYPLNLPWNLLVSARRVRAAIAFQLGLVDEAERGYRDALAWCERERCPIEAGRCLQGLANVAERRGERTAALRLLDRAATLFQQHGAKLYLDQVITKKLDLQGVAVSGIFTSIDAIADTVQHERPSVSVHPAPDGTVTIMFSDIEDSTVLTERLGDLAWQALLREHNALIREQVRAYGGYEVKTMGDGFMVAFQSAKKALECAIAIQKTFANYNVMEGESLMVRIGLHAGEMVKDGSDFYGKNVILASRVAGQAKGGEILVSSLLRQLVESSVSGETFASPREVTLKGLSGRHTLYEVRTAS